MVGTRVRQHASYRFTGSLISIALDSRSSTHDEPQESHPVCRL